VWVLLFQEAFCLWIGFGLNRFGFGSLEDLSSDAGNPGIWQVAPACRRRWERTYHNWSCFSRGHGACPPFSRSMEPRSGSFCICTEFLFAEWFSAVHLSHELSRNVLPLAQRLQLLDSVRLACSFVRDFILICTTNPRCRCSATSLCPILLPPPAP